jgi:hypothetical protein
MFVLRSKRCAPAATVLAALLFAGAPFFMPVSAGAAGIVVPAPVYAQLGRSAFDELPACAKRAHATVAAYVPRAFTVGRVQLTSGATIYTARSTDPCLSEGGDAAIVAYVATANGAYRRVMIAHAHIATYGADGSLVLTMYDVDSTAVVYRMIFHFDGTTYAAVRSEDVYLPTGEVKPSLIPLHFAYGSSSATVSGNVRDEYSDTYILSAAKGQTMSVIVRRKSGTLSGLEIVSPSGIRLQEGLEFMWRDVLPETGRYAISVAGGNGSTATYSMTVTIR